jgi:pSer/pThr/pTyr-binding forkhead associated (FHA) protein
LIIHGTQIIPLTQGSDQYRPRRWNDLVIGDLQVSREHAQLRAVRGRYMIFDLNSTGGTFVNGVQISQLELTPGDLISLAGIPIILVKSSPILVEETQDLGDINPSEGKDLGK